MSSQPSPQPSPQHPGRLADKVAVVTGAGAGFGASAAVRFAAEGAAVVVADLDLAAATETVTTIEAAGGVAAAVQVDVASSEENERMVAACLERFGRVDVLFANAGIAGAGTAVDLSEEEWQRVIAVNLTSVWLAAKHALPDMLARGSGSIINTASVGGLVGVKGILPYAAAKGGVIAMTRQMAADFGAGGVRVNAICPGTVPTRLVTDTYEERVRRSGSTDVEADARAGLAEMAAKYPAGRLGRVEDVASLALFLASDESSWMTGAVLPVDGGYTAV